ncbi:MAG TPA: LysM peptidoglycan-binding domain-containing protein [Ilumatobacter sp.]|nr:LysM peptidoglycan-binding domain-containing protein [Ilumatobacter sp.]
MKLVVFMRSLVALAVIVVAAPWAMIRVASLRFGGPTPWFGVPSPAQWRWDQIQPAMTNRLTEATIADVVIRVSLAVAWVAIATLVITVFAELRHMARHHGLPMPDIRGLGLTQRAARVIAAGLLVVNPMVGSTSRAVASDTSMLVASPRSATAHVAEFEHPEAPPSLPVRVAPVGGPHEVLRFEAPLHVEAGSTEYVVKAGDSIYGIAGRFAGPSAAEVADYAERLLDLNIGRTMPDGEQFNNAAFIDVGWTLVLPESAGMHGLEGDVAPVPPLEPTAMTHVVVQNESLWSIAADELGDGHRWDELFAANEGRAFADGRVFADPAVIQPGWELLLPGGVETQSVEQPAPVEPVEDLASSVVELPAEVPGASDAAQLDASADVDVEPAAALDIDALAVPTNDEVRSESDVPPPAAALPNSAVNSWQAGPVTNPSGVPPVEREDLRSESSVQLITLERAAMLAGGVLLLLAARRRQQLRAARPRARIPAPAPAAMAAERQLRTIGGGERFVRVDLALRAAAPALVERGARLAAMLVADDGSIELWATGPANLRAPWQGIGDRWSLAGDVPLEALAPEARRVIAPSPTLAHVGVQRGSGRKGDRDVYIDLEALGAVEVGGTGAQADAVVAAIASTLSSSVLAEVSTLIGVGVPDEAFLGHRLHVGVSDVTSAYAAAAEAIGSTSNQTTPTFELRTRGTGGDSWDPAVVLVGASVGDTPAPANGCGLAVISASPIVGPSSRLAPDGDAWALRPLGLRFVPIGLSEADLATIASLVEPAQLDEFEPSLVDALGDHTITGYAGRDVWTDDLAALEPVDVHELDVHELDHHELDDHSLNGHTVDDATVVVPREPATRPGDVEPVDNDQPAHSFLIRLLGPISVESADGTPVDFERSKTKELLAWMVTHRERSTRTLARTGMWELDVRDATFANVVSEARRALARVVEPPEGDEWVGRTLTEALPLHSAVRSDADALRTALQLARLQPPSQAIATLAPAVDLIRGMPFEGVSYLWADPEGIASNLVLLATTAAAELAAHCLSVGDVEGVFAATGRGLAVLPGHEELIGLRMRAHSDAGDLAGVRLEWESYSRALLADPWSDGEPSPKLVSLRAELLSPAT